MALGLHQAQKMGLSLVLAPQLQQSLAILQANALELKAKVEQELQENPLLEQLSATEIEMSEKSQREDDAATALDPTEPPRDVLYDPATEKPTDAPVDKLQVEWEKLLQIDKDYGNLSEQGGSRRVTEEDEERRQFMFDSITTTTTLHDNLMEQVRTSDLSPEILAAAELVVGNIDDYGYLKATPEELAQNHQIPLEVVQKAIQTIQTFQPAGVGAADLRECLLLQLDRAGRKDSLEYRIVDQQMEALGKRRMPEMAKALDCSIDEIQDAVQLIGKLDPRPGRAYLPDNDQFVVPEVFVTKVNGEYVVTSNNDHIPQIRISNHYKDIMSRAQTDNEARDYIRDKIKAGKFFINSLHQRQRTILNIAKEIVRRQRGFMEHGISALVPMTMVQVAESVDPQVHETTVSRAVSGKYIQTPQGMFEMKFFFTSGIATSTGGEMSNTSVKDIISEIFSNENPAKPLSDAEVVKMLEAREIMIARRTVAKYRDELNILPSNLRKVY